ncbi:response regulator [Massilia sp. CCM 8734]|uniref:response regulator n=1 Tax=Massilia sp. CCM 8734 TaxID=2609283 RepID=UPI001420DF9E|nr:response regulator [Massilia sp. CCM 8734]
MRDVKLIRILVVDDNREAADALVEILTLCGHHAVPAYDGMSALAVAARLVPDTIFLDIGMPGMSGIEVSKELRQLPALRHTQVVALTAWGDAATREQTTSAGFDLHLVKPADIHTILAALQPIS